MTPTLDEEFSCPECGEPLWERREGLSYALRCSKCSWEAVTTYSHPFDHDAQTYALIVTSLGEDPSRSLLALNRRFTHGIARTRELFGAGEHQLKSGRARDIWEEAQQLRTEGIAFRSEPDFPYDLDDPTLAIDYSYEWRPITA